MRDPFHATREHLVPKSRGGKEIAISCILCNGVKGDMTAEEYRFFLRTRTLADSYIEWMTQVKIRTLRTLGVEDGNVRLHQN
jgi:hypothetical protein